MNCRSALGFFLLFTSTVVLEATAEQVEIRVPQPEAWMGQRLTFFVDLRARGSFSGATQFSLPQIPRTVIIKVGNPTVSSETRDGESYFVQTHRFSLFSQQEGTLEIPSFNVRYGARDGFTGPVKEWQLEVPSTNVSIKRPPQSEGIGFVVTAETLEVKESWEPEPSDCEVGSVLKRTISIRANQMTGMALPPPPEYRSDNVRVYQGQPEIMDETERSAFIGSRRDTITYLIKEPGTITLPAITYVWWNPIEQQLRSTTLEGFTIEATMSQTVEVGSSAPGGGSAAVWVGFAIIMIVLVIARKQIHNAALMCWGSIFTTQRVAKFLLRRACHQNDQRAALRAWNAWNQSQSNSSSIGEELQERLLELRRSLYGPEGQTTWNGQPLWYAIQKHVSESKAATRDSRSDLPSLNP